MAIFLLTVIIGVFVFAMPDNLNRSSERFVSATIFPVYDLTRQIAGDRTEVQLILPSGASPHTFEVTPQIASKIDNSKVVFKIGIVDDWIDNVSGDKAYTVDKGIAFKSFEIAEFGEEEEEEGDYDPHYWTDPKNARIMAKNIYDKLVEIDPEGKDQYSVNYEELSGELKTLDEEIIQSLSPYKDRNIITFHDAWGYFVDAYDLKIAAVLLSSPGKEITPGDIKSVGDAAKNAGATAVFYEPQFSNDIVDSFARDFNLKTGVLDAEGGDPKTDTYVSVMRRNTQNIVNALK